MSKCEPTENVSVSVPISLLAITDHFCKEADLTRSQAFNWLHGDRKAMKEYLKHYRNRPLSTPQRTASMLRGRKANQPLGASTGRAGADPGRPPKGGSDVEGTQNPHGLEGRRHLEAQGEGECNRGANLRLCGPDDQPAHAPGRPGGYGRFSAYLRPHLLEVGPWRGTL